MTVLDRTLMKCPFDCLLPAALGETHTVEREFEWCDEAEADVGTRRYCENCGAKLIEADQ